MTPVVYGILFAAGAALLAFGTWVIVKHRTASQRVKGELAADDRYRALAEEYRRLSDMAITAQEHSDIRLSDMSVRIDDIREQLERMQTILKEVE